MLANSDVPLEMPAEFVTKRLEYALGESVPRYVRVDGADGKTVYKASAALPKVGVQGAAGGREYVDAYVTRDSATHSAAVISALKPIDFTAKTGKNEGQQLSAYQDVRILVKGKRTAYGEKVSVYDGEV